MSFNPLVSCIIPVYNAEKYLKQGVDSLLAQTYENLEIILVDDLSTDDSWNICQDYTMKYPNILAFRNISNSGGPLRGRQRGIMEANGEWLTFMDCDDYVKPKYIENLVKGTGEGRYDISITGHSRLYHDGKVEDFLWDSYSQSTEERLLAFYNHYFIDQDFWTDPADTIGQNLIRASVAKKTDLSKYPDTIWGEDTLMALAFLANSKKGVNFVDQHDFYWRQRVGSGSHGGFSMTANRNAFYSACYDIFNAKKLLPLVTVVIPVFNVEEYLADCIESVLTQTYPNLDIVLVDDKSPDGSGRIADDYVRRDKRIRVLHKSRNEGLNMARASGFKASSGEYVMFMDSDDLLVDDCIETALRGLLTKKTDFIRFGMVTFKDREDLNVKLANRPGGKEVVLKGKKNLYMTQFDPGRILGDLPMNSMTVWGALYIRKSVEVVNWNDTNFQVYEDNVWTLRFLENVTSGVYSSHIGYLYRSDDAITNVLSKKLTDNTFNGKPIGYMEFWSYVWSEYRRYNRKYEIGAEKIIDDVIKHLFIYRANHLSKAGLWGVENNSKYLEEAAKIYQENLEYVQHEVMNKDRYINQLESEIEHFKHELAITQAELKSHLSIKRSTVLTLGNIKRRIARGKVIGDRRER